MFALGNESDDELLFQMDGYISERTKSGNEKYTLKYDLIHRQQIQKITEKRLSGMIKKSCTPLSVEPEMKTEPVSLGEEETIKKFAAAKTKKFPKLPEIKLSGGVMFKRQVNAFNQIAPPLRKEVAIRR